MGKHLLLADMLDDLDSTRVKLRLASRRRAADRAEQVARDVHTNLRPAPPEPDGDGPVPLGGYL